MAPEHALLFLGSQAATGGAQMVLLNQANWFFQRGYGVTVAFLYDKQDLIPAWRRQYPFPILDLGFRRTGASGGSPARFLAGCARLLRLLRAGRFEAVETFTHHSNLIGLPLAWLAGAPARVATHHGRIFGFPRALERLHAWMINRGLATCLVAVTEPMRAAAVQEGVRPERIVVIPNGIRPISADPQARIRGRASLGQPPDALLVLSVGRLAPEKGHTHLLTAAPAVLKHHPRAQFLLAGDGPLRAQLQAQATGLGLDGQVSFLGVRDDVSDLLAAADVFVLPSITEGLPLALLEAMSAGLAVVASDAGGVGSALAGGRAGRLIPPGDPAALAAALVDLLARPEERARLGETGRECVIREYSLDEMCEQYAQLFRQNRPGEKA